MELLNNIWNALTTPNETLIKIILLPSAIIETIFTLIIFTTVFNLKTTTKQNTIYVLSCSMITFLSKCFIPSPYSTFINYICIFVIICFIFKTTLLQGLIASIISTLLFALVGILILNPYFTLLNIGYEESATIPIYRIIYLALMYFINEAQSTITKTPIIIVTILNCKIYAEPIIIPIIGPAIFFFLVSE